MKQITESHLLEGTLLDQHNVLHNAELVVLTKHRSGPKKRKSEVVTLIEFAQQPPVPDGGPYVIHYVLDGKQHSDRVNIKLGKLIAG